MRSRALLAAFLLAGCGLFPSLDGLTGPDGAPPEEAGPEAAADAGLDAAADALDDEAAPPAEAGCDAGSCNGGCVDLKTDPDNCGACGHDCLGASCSAGQCAVTVMVTGEDEPYDLAADDGQVYWTSAGSGDVATCDVTNCTNSRVTLANTGSPDDIAIDATNVYWTDNGGGVFKCARAGCAQSPTTLASGQSGIDGITTSGGVVYWSTSGAVVSCAATGCSGSPATFLAHSCDDLSVSGNLFFAAAFSHVYACTLPSCTNLVTISSSSAEGVASDGQTIFFTSNSSGGSVYDCPVTGCSSAATFAAGDSPGDVVTDGVGVYWVDEGAGTGLGCPVSGCGGSPTVLASGLSGPKGVAVDSSRVYFADTGNGRIVWVAK